MLQVLLFFVLGAIAGSFVAAWVWRTKHRISIAKGRSRCPNCRLDIRWYDNIPIASYLLLKGRCRDCHKPISAQYPVVEFATGVLFAMLYLYFVPNSAMSWVNLLLWCIGSIFLIAAFVYDLKYMQLPDKFSLPTIGIATVLLTIVWATQGWPSVWPRLVATFVFTGIYLALWFFSKGKALGGGDVRLAIILGLLLPVSQLLVAVFVAYLAGALTGVVLIVIKHMKRTTKVPLAPFLIGGLYFGLFFGATIVSWYLNLI